MNMPEPETVSWALTPQVPQQDARSRKSHQVDTTLPNLMLGVRRTVFEAAGAEFVANKHQLGHKHAHRTAAFTPSHFEVPFQYSSV